MDNQNLIIFKFETFYKIFKELEQNTTFKSFEVSDYKMLQEKEKILKNYIIITKKEIKDNPRQVILDQLPIKFFNLIEKLNIEFLKLQYNEKSEFKVGKYKINLNSKKLCLIHLSSKWINKYFSEEKFIKLLVNLRNLEINIVMTTDNTSKNVFSKIFKKYEIITNEEFENLKSINNILILDQLNFDNWTSIINSSTYVITPECGCTHIASLSETKLCVIYDSDNLPSMIAEEYAPWKKKYTKLFSNNQNLEKELMSFIS